LSAQLSGELPPPESQSKGSSTESISKRIVCGLCKFNYNKNSIARYHFCGCSPSKLGDKSTWFAPDWVHTLVLLMISVSLILRLRPGHPALFAKMYACGGCYTIENH